MDCPTGYVNTSNSTEMNKCGYDTETKVYPQNVCLPIPCKWFFPENEESHFNDNNYYTSKGCVCDVINGWIPVMTKNACVPLFSKQSKPLEHKAVSLFFVDEPQTLHQFNENITFATYIEDILYNENTKKASKKNFMHTTNIVAGEIGVNSFLFTSKNALDKLEASSIHEFIANKFHPVKNIKSCNHSSSNILCMQNAFLMLNEAVAQKQQVGGIFWEYEFNTLKFALVKKRENINNVDLKYRNNT